MSVSLSLPSIGELRAKAHGGYICSFSKEVRARKRNRCFFWSCLQRSNLCVIFSHREVLPLIANRLCTLAMCGVSRGRGPEKQAPSTLQFSFNSTEHNSLGHPGSSHAELCASRRPPCIAPLPLPTRPWLPTRMASSPPDLLLRAPSRAFYPSSAA